MGLLCSPHLFGEDEPAIKASLDKTARAFVDLLDKGEFEKAAADFDEAMLRALPARKLKETWGKVVGDAGLTRSR